MPLRIKAALTHLLVSFLIVSTVLILVILVWYPGNYFGAAGVSKILFVFALVDVCAGPLITLIIYNPFKRSLKMDLGCIALLQFVALVYGVNAIYSGRPVYLVFNVDMFTIVSATDIADSELKKSKIKYLPRTGPVVVGARLPLNSNESRDILFSALNGGADLPQLPRYYLPYESLAVDVKKKMLEFDALKKRIPEAKSNDANLKINAALKNARLKIADVGFIPIRGKIQDMTMMVRRSDSAIVEMLAIDPWGN
ncbi:hypothetical protein RCH09_002431 [Actimicrobium sp. GrIS 1.19]|uniref:TfpX/TfpZ family type IV pilin accessory protein n=1 Tax=Actimicrobium sp. GrIS 1.19 TaxID=3071708 RepID=UPI002DFF101A|nr:hypothetical protein [Actimicrobium sp. GrIS 1.19]